jgi:hypothetical protein
LTDSTVYPLDVQMALQARRQNNAPNIPLDLREWPLPVQCRIPNQEIIAIILPAYVRYIARQNEGAERPVESIRVYRVMHMITAPDPFVGGTASGQKIGTELKDPTTYLPYYLGRFNKNGELLDPDDPMLYWLVPIRKNPSAHAEDFGKKQRNMTLDDYKRLYEDFVYQHAGSHHMEGEFKK